jgi:oxygen-independent coproporphyrinogen-3 oxidase
MSFSEYLAKGIYQGYIYAYPHKMAYRQFEKKRSLRDVWASENTSHLFLYVHVPFCETRCGFCNLFSLAQPGDELVEAYLSGLIREIETYKSELGKISFSRIAIGGGTPSYLDIRQLERLLKTCRLTTGTQESLPFSFEIHPSTITLEKARLLKEFGVSRISMGVQSFVKEEVQTLQRRQDVDDVCNTFRMLNEIGFSSCNLDLMYGIPGQTRDTWLSSLQKACEFDVSEIFLYPLYVRPLTGLGMTDYEWDDLRLELYRIGRDFLRDKGYSQLSMRAFSKKNEPTATPAYCCQEDGMIGIGPGARSYTRTIHYCTDYGVGRARVKAIIEGYSRNNNTSFQHIDHGFLLNRDEQKRRYLLKSILHTQGLVSEEYTQYLNADVLSDFPQIRELIELGYIIQDGKRWRLTESGLELSDVIGPYFSSEKVNQLVNEYELS